eukprot:RCo040232
MVGTHSGQLVGAAHAEVLRRRTVLFRLSHLEGVKPLVSSDDLLALLLLEGDNTAVVVRQGVGEQLSVLASDPLLGVRCVGANVAVVVVLMQDPQHFSSADYHRASCGSFVHQPVVVGRPPNSELQQPDLAPGLPSESKPVHCPRGVSAPHTPRPGPVTAPEVVHVPPGLAEVNVLANPQPVPVAQKQKAVRRIASSHDDVRKHGRKENVGVDEYKRLCRGDPHGLVEEGAKRGHRRKDLCGVHPSAGMVQGLDPREVLGPDLPSQVPQPLALPEDHDVRPGPQVRPAAEGVGLDHRDVGVHHRLRRGEDGEGALVESPVFQVHLAIQLGLGVGFRAGVVLVPVVRNQKPNLLRLRVVALLAGELLLLGSCHSSPL